MNIKSIKKTSIILPLLVLFACSSTSKVITDEDKSLLTGAGIQYSIISPANMRSNLGSAMLLGSLGHSLKGSSLQKQLGIKDPANYVSSGLEQYLIDKYKTEKGNQYKVVLETYFWEVNDPIMDEKDNLHISIGSRMKLLNEKNTVIASDECYEHLPMIGDIYLSEKDLNRNYNEKFSKAFMTLASKCVKRFELKL